MLGIVILNWQSWQLCIDCIKSIRETTSSKVRYKIYIVDNGSTNDSIVQLSSYYANDDQVVVLGLKENRGFAVGNNYAIYIAIKDGCDKILVTNSDIVFSNMAIEKMLQDMDSTNSALISPIVYTSIGDYQGSHMPLLKRFNAVLTFFFQSRLSSYPPFKSIKRKYCDVSEINKLTEIFWFPGCCFLLNSKDISEVNYLDENTFLYFEEAILSEKFYRVNKKMFISPEAMVIHLGGGSTNKSFFDNPNGWIIWMQSRAIYFHNYRGIPKWIIACAISVKICHSHAFSDLSLKEKFSIVGKIINDPCME